MYFFKSKYMGRKALTVYHCDENNDLERVTYFVEFPNLDKAKEFFLIVKISLLEQHGESTISSNTKSYSEARLSDLKNSTGYTNYMLFWDEGNLTMMLSIIPSESKPDISIVTIGVARKKSHSSSNIPK